MRETARRGRPPPGPTGIAPVAVIFWKTSLPNLISTPSTPFAPTEVFVVGLRGIPEVLGGVERHCQNLYPILVRDGYRARVYARSGYVPRKPYEYKGVRVVPLSSIRHSNVETVTHTLLAVLHAARQGAELLHIHAIGPALWTHLAKRMGMKVVVTHHGFDYRRSKWGSSAKTILRKGEQAAIRHADGIICISGEIHDSVLSQHPAGRVVKIPNGVPRPSEHPSSEPLARWGLRPGGYILLTARFVQEKGICDLIRAWDASGIKERCSLVVAGGEDHPSSVGQEIQSLAAATGAVLPGVVTGGDLASLYGHARGFALPSYHEGLPISLLEAMSWNLPIVASDIRANLEVGLDPACHFTAGDLAALASRLRSLLDGPERIDHSSLVAPYDWEVVARRTSEFYQQILSDRPSGRARP